MKHNIFIFLLLFCAAFARAQEKTTTLMSVWGETIDTLICDNDTISRIFFKKEMEVTDWGVLRKDTVVYTVLFRSGNCPADSLETYRQLAVKEIEIQNRAQFAMSNAFSHIRRGHTQFLADRTIINNWTGSDLYIYLEDLFFQSFTGKYRIIDVEANTSVVATMVRVGADNRYRLEVDQGEVGAGKRYTVIPLSANSFQINNWASATRPAATFRLYKDTGTGAKRPVFRTSAFITGTTDVLRIVKIQ